MIGIVSSIIRGWSCYATDGLVREYRVYSSIRGYVSTISYREFRTVQAFSESQARELSGFKGHDITEVKLLSKPHTAEKL